MNPRTGISAHYTAEGQSSPRARTLCGILCRDIEASSLPPPGPRPGSRRDIAGTAPGSSGAGWT